MSRRRSRNPVRFTRRQYAVAAAAGGLGALALYWRLRRSKSDGGVKIFPAKLILPIPEGQNQEPTPEEDKTRNYGATVTIEVSKFGDTYDVVLTRVDPGEEFDIEVELRVTHYLKYNKYYGAPMHQFCLGVVLRGHVKVDNHNATITNAEVEQAPLLCGDNDLSIPWPNNYGVPDPAVSLDFDGHDLVVSIEAPPLMYGTEIVEPGKGYSVDWWKDHTQPHRYDMIVSLVATETKT